MEVRAVWSLFNVGEAEGSALHDGGVLRAVALDDTQGVVARALDVAGFKGDLTFVVLDEHQV